MELGLGLSSRSRRRTPGLWTRTVTESVFIVRADELLTAFVETRKGNTRLCGELNLIMANLYRPLIEQI